MSVLSDYTQDEIEKLMASPLLVSMYVMGSSLSGPIGLVQEMMAGVETALKAGKSAAPGTLFADLWSEQNMKAQQDKMQQETKESTKGAQNMDQAKAQMKADITAATNILRQKGSPDEVTAFQNLMVDVAQNVANAAKEGGFMGIGGTQVNDAEKQALADIRTAVGLDAPAANPAPAVT